MALAFDEQSELTKEALKNQIHWKFGNTKEMADELAGKVRDGLKTATTGLMGWKDSPKFPPLNEESCITDFEGRPVCIVRVTRVRTMKFNEVPTDHAAKEDHRDPRYDHWRKLHIQYFKSIHPGFTESNEVVCVEFELLRVCPAE